MRHRPTDGRWQAVVSHRARGRVRAAGQAEWRPVVGDHTSERGRGAFAVVVALSVSHLLNDTLQSLIDKMHFRG